MPGAVLLEPRQESYRAFPLLPPQIRAPTTALIIGPLCSMLGCFPTAAGSQHFSRHLGVTAVRSQDCKSHLTSSQSCWLEASWSQETQCPAAQLFLSQLQQTIQTVPGCCEDHRKWSVRPPQRPARPLCPFHRPRPWPAGWVGQCVRQSSHGLEKVPKASCARLSSLSPLFLTILKCIYIFK